MIQISYPITIDCPLYPGTPPVSISPVKEIRNGDSSTTSLISFSSHAGTHMDLPSHVCLSEKPYLVNWQRLKDIRKTICIDLPKIGESPILPLDIPESIDNDINALLIRTGNWKIRRSDPDQYSCSHPWLHPDCAIKMRECFPSLFLIGVDLVSITSPNHKKEGREAHRRLLCEEQPILILEDLDLSSELLLSKSLTLIIIPYVQELIDGIPVFCYINETE